MIMTTTEIIKISINRGINSVQIGTTASSQSMLMIFIYRRETVNKSKTVIINNNILKMRMT